MASAIEQYPFWPKAEVAASSVLKVVLMERRVLNGRTAIITTIIMGKMEIVLPEVYTSFMDGSNWNKKLNQNVENHAKQRQKNAQHHRELREKRLELKKIGEEGNDNR